MDLRSIVKIETHDRRGRQLLGTGFILTPNRLVATCYHVVFDEAGNPRFPLSAQYTSREPQPLKIVAHDRREDVALLQIALPPSQDPVVPARLASRDAVPAIEEKLKAYGYSGDLQMAEPYSVVISSFVYGHLGLQSDVNPGDSGGPLVLDGQVVGIVRSKNRDEQGKGRAIPIGRLYDLADREKIGLSAPAARIGRPAQPTATRPASWSTLRNELHLLDMESAQQAVAGSWDIQPGSTFFLSSGSDNLHEQCARRLKREMNHHWGRPTCRFDSIFIDPMTTRKWDGLLSVLAHRVGIAPENEPKESLPRRIVETIFEIICSGTPWLFAIYFVESLNEEPNAIAQQFADMIVKPLSVRLQIAKSIQRCYFLLVAHGAPQISSHSSIQRLPDFLVDRDHVKTWLAKRGLDAHIAEKCPARGSPSRVQQSLKLHFTGR